MFRLVIHILSNDAQLFFNFFTVLGLSIDRVVVITATIFFK
jgi:hypothetical protein